MFCYFARCVTGVDALHDRSLSDARTKSSCTFCFLICKGFWFLLVFFRVHLVRKLYIKVPIRTICARDESVFHSSCTIAIYVIDMIRPCCVILTPAFNREINFNYCIKLMRLLKIVIGNNEK